MTRAYDGSPLATDRQTGYIMALAQKVQGGRVQRLSDVRCIYLTQRERYRGGMSRREASTHIDELLAILADRDEED